MTRLLRPLWNKLRGTPRSNTALDAELTALEPEKIGVIYECDNFTDLSAFTGSTTGYAVSGGKIIASTNNTTLALNQVTMLDKRRMTVRMTYQTMSGFGLYCGFKSANTGASTISLYGAIAHISSGVIRAVLYSEYDNFTVGGSGIAASSGDIIKMVLDVDGALATVTVTNETSGLTSTASDLTDFVYGVHGVSNNTARVTINNQTNSTLEILSLKYESDLIYNPPRALVGDSISAGYFAGARANRLGELLDAQIMAGSSDRTDDVLLRINEIITTVKPVKCYLMIGTNGGNTWQADMLSIDSQLIAAGISPIWLTPPANNYSDLSDRRDYIAATFPTRYVDLYAVTKSASGTGLNAAYDSGDQVHLNAAGNLACFEAIRAKEHTIAGYKLDAPQVRSILGVSTLSGSNTGDQDLSGKQNTLVSGTNIKTINGNSVLGSGNLSISGGGSTNASDLVSGTLADARLSSNVPLKNAANTFTADQSISGMLEVAVVDIGNANQGGFALGVNGNAAIIGSVFSQNYTSTGVLSFGTQLQVQGFTILSIGSWPRIDFNAGGTFTGLRVNGFLETTGNLTASGTVAGDKLKSGSDIFLERITNEYGAITGGTGHGNSLRGLFVGLPAAGGVAKPLVIQNQADGSNTAARIVFRLGGGFGTEYGFIESVAASTIDNNENVIRLGNNATAATFSDTLAKFPGNLTASGVGSFNQGGLFGTPNYVGRVTIQSLFAGDRGLVVQGFSGQTANQIESRSSAGAVEFAVAPGGNLTASGILKFDGYPTSLLPAASASEGGITYDTTIDKHVGSNGTTWNALW